jgi:glycerol-3-phosphate acyltransferase PlsY
MVSFTDFSSISFYFISCILAYLLGALPTGYLFAKCLFGVTITQMGSGNIGASNVGRVLGKKYFPLIFLIDAGKAFLALTLTVFFLPSAATSLALLAGPAFALLIGNAYSLFLGFSGGKGVATVTGILAFIAPLNVIALFALLWLVCLAISKEPFIASFAALIWVTAWAFYLGSTSQFLFILALLFWVLLRHSGNIRDWCAQRFENRVK